MRFTALLLAMVMVMTTLVQPIVASPILQNAEDAQYFQLAPAEEGFLLQSDLMSLDGVMPIEHLDLLTFTLEQEAVGVFGFEGFYELPANPNEMVEIVVQFRTLPAVAQRLVAEANVTGIMPFGSGQDADMLFVPDALEGHSNFLNQLGAIPMPASSTGGIEIISEHHMLFNGVFMNVPSGMVELIASLPEVFAVTPAMVPYTLMELEAMANGTFELGVETASTNEWYHTNNLLNAVENGVLVVPTDFQENNYIWHPEFNQGARNRFELDYINEEMGLTGAGIRVGIIDTGIDYRHPAFWHMLRPVANGAGFVRDESGQYWSLGGGNFMTAPVSGRGVGPSTSGMEMIHGPTHSTHGTHVAGIALGMAPGIQLYSFRILTAEPGGGGVPSSPLRAIEYAYSLGLDVINNSWGYVGNSNHPWYAFTFATNVAALAGMVSTNATGNDGMGGAGANNVPGNGGWFSLGGGASTASLGISVASGQGANRYRQVLEGATVNQIPTDINLIGTPAFSVDTQAVLGRDMDYVWFNRIELPAGGRTNPAYPAFLTNVRNLLNTNYIEDLSGKVAVINRGGGEFVTMIDMAIDLGAYALIVINNTADNNHITGTVLNNAGQIIPAFSVRANEGGIAFGADAGTPIPVANVTPVLGVLDFGQLTFIPSPDIKTASSSIGPLGPVSAGDSSNAIMHVFPSVTAPGASIVSTWTISHPTQMDGRSYNAIGGTSMAGPAVAGIVALMLEHFDAPLAYSSRPETRAVEMQARLMQSSRPLADYTGQYSVNQVGAGFIDPLAALNTTAFATTVHPVPFGLGVEMDDITYQTVPNHMRVFADHTMASLSFGRISIYEGDEEGKTATLPITIHGNGVWTFAGLEWQMPTQELRNPVTGGWTGNWGPRLQHTVNSVGYNMVSLGQNQYEIYLTHNGIAANRGFAQGHITFTNGNGDEIFMIFGAYFDVKEASEEAVLTPLAGTGIWRPVISGFVSPNTPGFDDPREFPGGFLTNPGIFIMTARSNYSPVTFGFADSTDTPRDVRFYVGPYGSEFGDSSVIFHTQFAGVAPGSNVFSGNLLRPIIGGELWNITGQPQWQASNGYVLSQGVYTLFMHVANPGGEDLIVPKTFVVTTDRPTIEFDEEVFVFEADDQFINITGSINSFGHEMAIKHDVTGMTAFTGSIALIPENTGTFDFSQTWLRVDGESDDISVNPDGTFSFVLEIEADEIIEPTDIHLLVSDGEGVSIVPNILGMWNSVTWGASNRSLPTPFTFAEYEPTQQEPITLTFFARSPLTGGGWHNGTAWSHSILTITLEEGDYLDWYTINTAYEAHVYSGGFENDRTEGWFAQGPGVTRTLFEDEAQISFDFFAEILGNPTQRQIFIDTVAGDIIPVPYVYFTVAFDTAGGSYIPAQQVRQGELVVRPEDPTKEGYTFTGWYFISPDWTSPWNFYGHRINWDNTITATWEAIPTFTVTFDTAGGSYVPAQQVQQGELVVRPADPTREGYTFAGWYFVSPGWTSPWNFYGHRINWDNTVTAVWNVN